MTRLTTSEARNDFAEILNRVAYQGERVILHRRGKNVAAIIPMEELALLEKLIQAAEDKDDLEEIRKAKKDIARKGTIPWDEIKKELGL
jgi:prevent-host-death family protein